MKHVMSTLAVFAFVFSWAAGASSRFNIGDKVDVSFAQRQLETVVDIASDGSVLLSDGQWYLSEWVHALRQSYNGIHVGDEVVEAYDSSRSRLHVIAISDDGTLLLSNNQWYDSNWIHTLLQSYEGIRVGDLVVETYDSSRSRLHVIAISDDGDFLLSNEQWYSSEYIQTLASNRSASSVTGKLN